MGRGLGVGELHDFVALRSAGHVRRDVAISREVARCAHLRLISGAVRVSVAIRSEDRHVAGLFAREEWLRFLGEAGFEPRSVIADHSALDPVSYEIFVAKKPG